MFIIQTNRRKGLKPGVKDLRVDLVTKGDKNFFPELGCLHFSLLYLGLCTVQTMFEIVLFTHRLKIGRASCRERV